jgi:hypothetical protein
MGNSRKYKVLDRLSHRSRLPLQAAIFFILILNFYF